MLFNVSGVTISLYLCNRKWALKSENEKKRLEISIKKSYSPMT